MDGDVVYVATINTPGYLPESDPFYSYFQSECWSYLADERQRAEDSSEEDGPYSDTLNTLRRKAEYAANGAPQLGTVYSDTPGYTGSYDLGTAYTVDTTSDVALDEESDTWVERKQ